MCKSNKKFKYNIKKGNSMTPNKNEAFNAIPDLLYVIDQCKFIYDWSNKIRPSIPPDIFGEQTDNYIDLIHNSIVESTLMFVRKLNEFFSRRDQEKGNEALRASHFGDFPENGWFLTKKEFDELHMRVGHISLEEVRSGKKEWSIDYIQRALTKAKSFLEFLLRCPEVDDKMRIEIAERILSIKNLTSNTHNNV
jgi:hypothetical protein